MNFHNDYDDEAAQDRVREWDTRHFGELEAA